MFNMGKSIANLIQMNIQLRNKVNGNYKDMVRQFDRKLFEALMPSHAAMEIVVFNISTQNINSNLS